MAVLLLLGFQEQFSCHRIYVGIPDDDFVGSKFSLQFGGEPVVLHIGMQEVNQPHTGGRMLV